jgi:hypothetical protein
MYSRRHFPNQKPNEHVIMFLRRHWIAPLKIISVAAVLILVPLFVYYGFFSIFRIFEHEVYKAAFILLVSAYYLFIVLFSFANFVDYYLDVWIITNQRVINIEQKGLFSRVISEKDLGTMQDITSDVSGFFPTLLDFGDVHIQTAAENENFIFKEVPFASEVARRISNLVSEYQKIEKTIDIDG